MIQKRPKKGVVPATITVAVLGRFTDVRPSSIEAYSGMILFLASIIAWFRH